MAADNNIHIALAGKGVAADSLSDRLELVLGGTEGTNSTIRLYKNGTQAVEEKIEHTEGPCFQKYCFLVSFGTIQAKLLK